MTEAHLGSRMRLVIGLCGAFILACLVWIGPVAVAVGVPAIALLLALGWSFLIDLPNPGTSRRVIAATGVIAPIVAYDGGIQGLTILGAAVVIAGFIAEMARRDGRPRLLEQISGTVTGGVLVIIASMWVIATGMSKHSAWLVLGSIAAAILGELLAPKREMRPLFGFVGGLIGAVLTTIFLDLPWILAIAAGLLTGLTVVMMDGILRRLPPAGRRRPAIAIAMVPLSLGGVIAFTCALIV